MLKILSLILVLVCFLKVMLISLKAGGVGLNLTAASNVFLMVLPHICCFAFYLHCPLLYFLAKQHVHSVILILYIKMSSRIHGGILQ